MNKFSFNTEKVYILSCWHHIFISLSLLNLNICLLLKHIYGSPYFVYLHLK